MLAAVLVLGTMLAAGCQKSEEADVVVVGGGGAGLAAAVSAAENGAKVILIEKMPMLGGNTIRSGGAYNAVDPERQKAQGIEDSVDKHFEQTFKGGDEKADPKLVRVLVENALAGLKWLESYGMKFQDKIFAVIGATWPRSHQAVDPSGTGFIKTLKAAAEKLGVKIYLETRATELITDSSGRVVGVKAETKDKKPITFKAKKGVVLATGGFSANVEMRTKYNPKLTANIPTTNHPGATGDGIVMAEKIGAATVGMEYIQLLSLATPGTGSLQGCVTIGIDSVIFVNKQGVRFVKEDARRDVLAEAVLAQEGGMYYMINDSKIVGETNQFGEKIEDLIKQGLVFKADTLKELAQKIGVPADALEKTVADFNKMVQTKNDPQFGRTVFANTIDKGPFYACPRVPAVHHTMGGLKINEKTEVISKDGKVIPGLYAAGEVTGGIHGSNRLGGNALPDTIVFGRIAGKNAALAGK